MIRAGAIVVADYPKAIEPTVASIEIRAGTAERIDQRDGEDSLRWIPFHRLSLADVGAAIGPLPQEIVHLFCNAPQFDDGANLLLTYDLHGLLYSFMWRESAGQWTDLPVPPELRGEADLRPSVRLVFKDERAKQSFLIYHQQVLAEKVHNPTLHLLFNRLACSPVVLPVATAKDTNGS